MEELDLLEDISNLESEVLRDPDHVVVGVNCSEIQFLGQLDSADLDTLPTGNTVILKQAAVVVIQRGIQELAVGVGKMLKHLFLGTIAFSSGPQQVHVRNCNFYYVPKNDMDAEDYLELLKEYKKFIGDRETSSLVQIPPMISRPPQAANR